jgi:hypothetical protein
MNISGTLVDSILAYLIQYIDNKKDVKNVVTVVIEEVILGKVCSSSLACVCL